MKSNKSSPLGPRPELSGELTTWSWIILLVSRTIWLLAIAHTLVLGCFLAACSISKESHCALNHLYDTFKCYFWWCTARVIIHIIFTFLPSPLPYSPNDMSEESCSASFPCMATEDQQHVWDKIHPLTAGLCFNLSTATLSHKSCNKQFCLLKKAVVAGVSSGNISQEKAPSEH